LLRVAEGEGVEISASRTTTSAIPCPRCANPDLLHARTDFGMTADMGAKDLRVFLAWWGITRHPKLASYDIPENYWPIVHEKFSEEEIWGWCREALVSAQVTRRTWA